MKKRLNILALIIAALGSWITFQCVEPYTTSAIQTDFNYLTVDGYLNAPDCVTTIHVGRTATIDAASDLEHEQHAVVQIVGDDGSTFDLTENSAGSYSIANPGFDPARTFQLQIKTSSGIAYESDFVPFRQTPPIDTLRWKVEDGNLVFLVNAHDPNDATHYYNWRFQETWSYHSAYYSYLKIVNGKVLQRDPGDDIYHCWRTVPNAQILVSSSVKLTHDVISDYEVQTLPLTSEKLQSEYSMLLEQRAITQEEYDYWQVLKKNTEEIGTLFGPQPSSVSGNMHCTTNPQQPALGYFGAGVSIQKRIIVLNNELPVTSHATGYENCETRTIAVDDTNGFAGVPYLIMETYSGLQLTGYLTSDPFCIDCTLKGGTTEKPDYWR